MISPAVSPLEKVKYPDIYRNIVSRLDEGIHGEGGHYHRDWKIGGFEDVIGEEFGDGFFYNTPTSTSQLVVALAVAPSPIIQEILREDLGSGSSNSMKAMRAKQVLSEFKLLDLGSGEFPAFALAAASLGAEVHTVDGEPICSKSVKAKLGSHTVINLCAPEAVATIKEKAGSEFDYVTTNIIGNVPGHPFWRLPHEEVLLSLGEQLLKMGGHYFPVCHDLMQKTQN